MLQLKIFENMINRIYNREINIDISRSEMKS